MKNRTVIIILTIALMLLSYILFVDQRLMTTGEQKARAENVFTTLRADLVDRIELETANEKIVLESNNPTAGEETVWRITSPSVLKADQTEVQALISGLDFLIYQRVVEENLSDARFGFATPKIKGIVRFKDRQITFRIGAAAPGADGVYVNTSETTDRFFVVSNDFLDAMNKTVADLRDKHLVDINAAEIEAIAIQNGSPGDNGMIEASRNNDSGNWQLLHSNEPVPGASSELKQLVNAAADLEVVKFISDKPTNNQPYGFDQKKMSVTLTTNSGKKTTVTLGGDCGNDTIYASVKGKSAVHCVKNAFENMLRNPEERYYEKQLVITDVDEIAEVAFVKGDRKSTISRHDDTWHVNGLKNEDISQTEFSILFDELKKKRADEVLFRTEQETGNDTEIESVQHSLPGPDDVPLITTTITAIDGTDEHLSIYSVPNAPERILVSRRGFPVWYAFSSDVIPMLTPHPARFRKKILEQCHIQDALTIDIETAQQQHQHLTKHDNKWLLDAPVTAETDKALVDKLLALACQTPIVAYPIEQEDPFANNQIIATVTVTHTTHSQEGESRDDTGTSDVVLEIGAAHDRSSRFARLQNNPGLIFTVDNQYTSFLTAPIAARNLLAIQSDIITKVAFKSKALTYVATKENGRWHSEECPVDSDALTRLVIDFGAVKAIETHSFNVDFKPMLTSIEFQGKPGTPPAILHFGELIPDNDGILAARDGLNISFVLPARLIRDMVAACTPNQ